jgi:hypothetical protein
VPPAASAGIDLAQALRASRNPQRSQLKMMPTD